jgi:hypothetical protein
MQVGAAPDCFASEFLKLQAHEDFGEGSEEDFTIGVLSMLVGAGADALCSVIQTFFKIMAMNPKAYSACQEGR